MPRSPHDQPSRIAYVALASTRAGRADAIAVVDVGAVAPPGGRVVGVTELPGGGNELRRLGWSAVDGAAPRRLLAPGLRSSCIHVLDCEGDPRRPALVQVIAPEELAERAGYAAPFAVHATRDAVYVSALGAADGEGQGGVLTLDPASLGVRVVDDELPCTSLACRTIDADASVACTCSCTNRERRLPPPPPCPEGGGDAG